MIGCSDVREHLEALAHGKLDEKLARKVHQHLAGCEECREFFGLERMLAHAATTAPSLPAPEGFADRVMERWERELLPAAESPGDILLAGTYVLLQGLRLAWKQMWQPFGFVFGEVAGVLAYAKELLWSPAEDACRATVSALKLAYRSTTF